jgi:hypothetical protein
MLLILISAFFFFLLFNVATEKFNVLGSVF